MVTLMSDWCSKQLSELITLINSKIDPQSLTESCHCIELEHIDSGTGKITGVQSSARVVSLKSRFTATDVLFGKLRPYLRKYAYPKFDGICSSEIWVFHPTEYITSSYLFYLIQSEWFINEANKTCGTKMPRAEWKALKDTVIKIPKSLSEQNAIASVLTNLDNLIESLEKLIAKKKLIKEGAMQDLLAGKKRLRGFDGEWVKCTLSNLGEFLKGKGISSDIVSNTGVPCIMYGDLYVRFKYDIQLINPYYRINPDLAKQSTKSFKGDLYFTATGETAEEIGKCLTYSGDSEIFVGGDIIILRPNDKVNSIFLAYQQGIQNVISQKISLAQGDARVHINQKSISSIHVNIPPTLEEQNAIASILTDMDAEIDALEAKLAKYRQIKTGAMQELLTGKIRLPA